MKGYWRMGGAGTLPERHRIVTLLVGLLGTAAALVASPRPPAVPVTP